MCYSVEAVANFFIEKSLKTETPLSNMHLQKMVFFAHAAYFKLHQKPLFSDPVVAWQHGPVVVSLYHELKQYESGKVTELIQRLEPCGNKSFFPCKMVIPTIPKDDEEVVAFLNHAWNRLSEIPTWKLRAISHADGGAWYKTVASRNIDPKDDQAVRDNLPRNLTILDSVIQECGR